MPSGTVMSAVIALAAGLLSFLSPCVMPLVPAYLGYLVGPAVSKSDTLSSRALTLLHAALFVTGFSVAFITLGASASLLGHFLRSHQQALREIGGILLVLLGLHATGFLPWKLLYREVRWHYQPARPGFGASFLVGTIFAIGWTPCVSTLLAPILVLAANRATLGQGILLLAFYSLGLGLPFLLVGVALSQVSRFLKKLTPFLRPLEITSGIFIIVMGVIIFFNLLLYLSPYFTFVDLG